MIAHVASTARHVTFLLRRWLVYPRAFVVHRLALFALEAAMVERHLLCFYGH